jgi:hypothetical protein
MEQAMTDKNESNAEKSGTRMMWIATAAIILLIVGMMGANVLFHKDTGPNETSSQSRTAPAQ